MHALKQHRAGPQAQSFRAPRTRRVVVRRVATPTTTSTPSSPPTPPAPADVEAIVTNVLREVEGSGGLHRSEQQ